MRPDPILAALLGVPLTILGVFALLRPELRPFIGVGLAIVVLLMLAMCAALESSARRQMRRRRSRMMIAEPRSHVRRRWVA